ncbi:zinc-type alcohol dehydrogenase [Trichoderma arundinaceum]|uniref:Zinc-type alcohol dehydrogenase n=1 Tax=Trichoderma arundinaceum TaxID=490622 RepID=A0A395NSH4_TRIAR|nr:zinc-type alcohol dehydrogenase [Trichoderma arundinaceum]
MVQSKGLIFTEIPTFTPVAGVHLRVESQDFDINQEAPDGGVIAKGLYFSLDPYMRGRMRAAGTKSYSPPYMLGQPVTAYSLVQVLKSAHEQYVKGDILFGQFNLEEYTVISKDIISREIVRKLRINPSIPLSNYLGILGSTGLTAYSSLYEIGEPKTGETIFVSSAAGAVGQIVGQIAKKEGLTVIGSVGDDAKLDLIKNLGYDGGFNYKKENTADALKRLAPQGIDIYYDNVGGTQLETAITLMNDFGRINEWYGVKTVVLVVMKRLKMQGFITTDANFGPKYLNERDEVLSKWLADGSIQSREDITEGIDNAATAFLAMLEGDKLGKAILKVADPDI